MTLKSRKQRLHSIETALTLSVVLASIMLPALADEVLVYSVKETVVQNKDVVDSDKAHPMDSKTSSAAVAKPAIIHNTETKTSLSDSKIVLGQNYVSIETSNIKTVYDFDKKRVLTINSLEKEYADTDLHSNVYFRANELQNRYMLGEVISKAGLKEKFFDPFDVPSLFAVSLPNDEHKTGIRKKIDKGGIDFEHDGTTVVSYHPSTIAIGAGDATGYRRLLTNLFPIHPEIRQAILAEKTFPEYLMVKSNDATLRQITSEYSLKSATTAPAITVTPPGDYQLVRSKELAAIYEALDKLGPNPKMPDKQAAMSAADQLLTNGNVLDALLTVLEYSLTTGDQSLPEMRKIVAAANKDSNVNNFMQSISAQSKEAARASIKVLETIDHSNLSKGHVIDIMRANTYMQLHDSGKAISTMKNVLSNHPLIVGAYHDLGTMYLTVWDVATGWDCFRIGRQLMPGHAQMEEISMMEKKLETDFPDFF